MKQLLSEAAAWRAVARLVDENSASGLCTACSRLYDRGRISWAQATVMEERRGQFAPSEADRDGGGALYGWWWGYKNNSGMNDARVLAALLLAEMAR